MILSDEQCQRLHAASLEILDRVGVRLYHQEAVDLLRTAGARVEDGNLVYVPSSLVEKALATAPKRVVMCNRHGDPVMPLEGDRCFYGPGSDTLHVVDHRTGERRKPLLRDVVEGTLLCDALPHVDFVMSMFVPCDVAPAVADRYQMEAMLSNTAKPVIIVSLDLQGLADAVAMAEAVAGGRDALSQKPFVACYVNVTTGLRHNQEALEKLLFLADRRLPALYIPVSTSGVCSPVTPAGSIAVDNAGMLVGLVLSQLRNEGAPFVAPGMQHSPLDMRTLVSTYCEPERGIAQALGRFYGLPRFALGGVSESKVVDQQAGIEAALTLMSETLSGGNIIHDLGYLESGLSFSLAQLTICNEIVSWIKAFVQGIEVSDETLALDLIAELRDEGNYLQSPHTRAHFRERWYPTLFERDTHSAWANKGGQDLGARASATVDRILDEHRPEPLPGDVRDRLRHIVQEAEKAARAATR
ncbi:MAG TPA: trimethylamine methyltransferase family protein [Anaerolineae bacterium]|nr:trimethylamine methyltransferase family protein [Anaerolineae bacterium]